MPPVNPLKGDSGTVKTVKDLSAFAAVASAAALSPDEVVKVRSFLRDVPRTEPSSAQGPCAHLPVTVK